MNIISQLNQEIEDLKKRRKSIQDKCSHPETNSQWHQSTDEYGVEDEGWYSHECLLCGKEYTVATK